MRLVIQRVSSAQVKSEGELCGKINHGYMVLVGIAKGDTPEIVEKVANKLIGLRINDDADGKMNLSIEDVGGSILSVSQFTLYANCRKGNRPGFDMAAGPKEAEELYEYFNKLLRDRGLIVETGRFQTEMQVTLSNEGPITIILDSEDLLKPKNG